MKVIAIIPARGGSKGIPGKNIYPILGKPLIEYSIEVALNSDAITEVWVSSDDPAILKVASKHQGIRIHERNPEIAGDTSPITQTIEAVCKASELEADAIMLLQPTSPIRSSENLSEAIELLESDAHIQSVISVVEMDDVHPARMYWRENGQLRAIMPEYETTRRQDIPKAYYRNGSVYLVRKDAFERTNQVMVHPAKGYVMPTDQLLNIDEPRDVLIAEPLIKHWLDSQQ